MWITVGDVIKAAEKNGFEWTNDGTWVGIDEDGYVVKGCILGQIAVNLGCEALELNKALNRLESPYYLGKNIYLYNDNTAKGYYDVLGHLKAILEPYKDKKIRLASKKWKTR